MKVAVTDWNGRVSPLFDAARTFRVVDIEGDKITDSREYTIAEEHAIQKVRRLLELDVDVLICGAVSNRAASIIDSSGIRLIPWVSGRCGNVLESFITDELGDSRFMMPGFMGRRRMRCGRGGERGTGRGWNGPGRKRGMGDLSAGRGIRRGRGAPGPGKLDKSEMED